LILKESIIITPIFHIDKILSMKLKTKRLKDNTEVLTKLNLKEIENRITRIE